MRLGLPWRSEPKPPPVETARFEQTSIALEHVMSRLEGARRCGVYDLGAPVSANVELYARHGSRITFADFYRFYEPTRPHGASAASFAELLPATATQVDIILAWDLLNYLSLEEISWLGQSLSATCAPGAILLALVSCPGLMPATPSNHTIVDDGTLRVEANGPPTRPSPAYSEQALLRSLPGLTVKTRVQLRCAMVEYLFKMVASFDGTYQGIPSRDVFAHINPGVEIEGPVMEDEGLLIHRDFWPDFLRSS